MGKKCLAIDKLLSEGWFDDEKEAQAWIMERNVLFNEQLILSPKEKVPIDSIIRIKKEYKRKYVNKGGLKLEKCLRDFNILPKDLVALDCGASTGGFTDCLLQYGAKLVYAVDVGFGQLAGKLMNDKRVINMEKTNLGDDILTHLDPKPELISLDLSYLSLKKAIVLCEKILGERGTVLCLVKPIYEVDSSEIRRNGEINDKKIIKDILLDLCKYFISLRLDIIGITHSAVTGNSGTLEYFIGVSWGDDQRTTLVTDIEEMVNKVIEKSLDLQLFKK